MRPYTLESDFIDQTAEHAVMASIAKDPALFWKLRDFLSPEVFGQDAERAIWQEMTLAIETEQPIPTDQIEGWEPATDPTQVAERLRDLYKRRLFAALLERIADRYTHPDISPDDLAAELTEGAAMVQQAIRSTEAGTVVWGDSVVLDVLRDAEERSEQHRSTGKPVMGLSTGIGRLDLKLNGLNEGLYLLGGPPGFGKTTLALQVSTNVSKVENVPVIYVTFENSPSNLVRKVIAAHARVNILDILRGYADLNALKEAAAEVVEMMRRVVLIPGTSRLTVADVRARARQAMNHCGSDRCLIVADYVQLWAKASQELRHLGTARERVETLGASLREAAMALHSPILGLSSQNRSGGNYGSAGKNGEFGSIATGSSNLDSLKESGDLEYAADVVLFLTGSERNATAPARAIDLHISKSRDGELGKVELIFRPDQATFREDAERRSF